MSDMKALSLHQPWASLVAVGAKGIETRSWPTRHRGRLLIHAAKVVPADAFIRSHNTPIGNALALAGYDALIELPRGAVVASCVLTDCVPIVRASDHAPEVGTFVHDFPGFMDDALWLVRRDDEGLHYAGGHIETQRPFGDFSPGRFAWLLDDVKPTTERCPRCWGEGRSPCEPFACPCHEPEWCADAPGVGCDLCRAWHGDLTCPTCDGAKVCDPVPMRGRQGLWTPTWQAP